MAKKVINRIMAPSTGQPADAGGRQNRVVAKEVTVEEVLPVAPKADIAASVKTISPTLAGLIVFAKNRTG